MARRGSLGITAGVFLLCCGLSPATRAGAQTCGNGLAEAPEECDDGNLVNGDGCSATCQLENASARCVGVPTSAGTALDAVRVASGLSWPTHITAPPLDPNRLFVVEKTGRIRIIKNGTLLAAPFLDLTGRVSLGPEQGLLSVAFHPNFEVNRRLFVDYTDNSGTTVIARYEASLGNPDVVDPASFRPVLLIAQPFPDHNGGQLAFGPDGYLYIGMGDGGGLSDPFESGQSDGTLLGKMLRLNIDTEFPPFYTVPPSNPNPVNNPFGLIWAKGLQNPWRFSFDRVTGDLYVGDIGGNVREEVDFAPVTSTGGENYGWDIFEGSQCFEPAPLFFPDCPSPSGYTFPVYEYNRTPGCGVVGGFVYRGCALPDLQGTYFFSDRCSPFVQTFAVVGGVAQNLTDRTADVAPGGGLSIDSVTSFGEDARGELYIADQDGDVFKLIPAVPTATPTVTPTPTVTWTPLDTATATATATATQTATASETATFTLTPTATDTATTTATATDTATYTATATATETATPTATDTATSTETATVTATATPTATDTDTPVPTATDTPVPPTSTAAPTDTAVPPTPTETFIAVTPTAIVEPSKTASSPPNTRTATRTRVPTRTPTDTATPSPTRRRERCRGDVDGDGHTGPNDLALVVRSLLSAPGRPRWNPDADLNHNGIVDALDVLIVLDSLLDPDCR
jgi:cysteine-rich repeat protein